MIYFFYFVTLVETSLILAYIIRKLHRRKNLKHLPPATPILPASPPVSAPVIRLPASPPVSAPVIRLPERPAAPVIRLPERPAERSNIQITDEFKKVERLLRSEASLIFVHGGAGTGKSTLIDWLSGKDLIQIRLAPTGIAALNIKGYTIHKFFSYKPVDIFPKKSEENRISRKYENILQNANVICIDEISMVRSDLLDRIDRDLKHFSGKDLPFGGYKMLFVGDLFQLPPVGNKESEKFFSPSRPDYVGPDQGWASDFFLDADCLRTQPMERVDLTHVFRQDSSGDFAKILNDLRLYKSANKNIAKLNASITYQESCPENTVVITTTNSVAKWYNEEKISRIKSEPHSFPAVRTGVFLTMKEKDLPAPLTVTLKKGEFVMLVCNDPDGSYVNGSTGRILEIRDGENPSIEVRLKNGTVIPVSVHDWESYEIRWNSESRQFYNQPNGVYSQYPLIPAYAITCHKSQGKTLDSIYLDMSYIFASGQLYTALSRVRNISDIILKQPLKPGNIIINKRLQEYIETGKI